jgi:hypothetical protein
MTLEPRDFLEDRSAFGSPSARWRPDASQDAHLVAAAFVQHQVAAAVAEARSTRRPRLTDEALAAAVGEKSAGALRRKLEGSRQASLADMVAWALVLGERVVEVLRLRSDLLFPEEYEPWMHGWRLGGGVLPRFRPRASRTTEVDWTSVVARLWERLNALARQRALGLLVHDAVRQIVIELLLEQGINALRCYLDEEFPEVGHVDLTVGASREDLLEVVFIPDSLLTADEVATAVREFAESVLRLANAPAEDRTIVAVLPDRVIAELSSAIPGLSAEFVGQGHVVELPWERLARLLQDQALLGDTSLEIRAVTRRTAEVPYEVMVASVTKLRPTP